MERLQFLFRRYMDQSASEEEQAELMQLLADPANETAIKNLLQQTWEGWPAEGAPAMQDADALYQEISQAIQYKEQGGKGTWMPLRRWRNLAAAAVVIFVVGAAAWWFLLPRPTHELPRLTAVADSSRHEVPAPAVNKAVLTLANGNTIVLDSARNGMLARQGNIAVIKQADGQIVYEGAGDEVLYNTLTNPRGSRAINLTLTDGTKVWLNSESSLRYPNQFTGDTRSVEITGEAYFEVTHDERRRFLVNANGITTEVLGTHFNVNAYKEETGVRVTLLEGSVKVISGGQVQHLTPGQQAEVNNSGSIVLHPQADIAQVMAWKNGLFSFKNTGLKNVMRQMARWYDLDVEYARGVPDITFSGEIGRQLTMNQVLDILAQTRIQYRVQGKTLVILGEKEK